MKMMMTATTPTTTMGTNACGCCRNVIVSS
jgi:hypothetical protein